jgi:altronate dehydratase
LREPITPGALTVGLDAKPNDELALSIATALLDAGMTPLLAPNGPGAHSHVELAALGAQMIVSLVADGRAPTSFVACPVLAVTRDPVIGAALRDDFDLVVGAPPQEAASRIVVEVVSTCNGARTAAETRGAADFVLRRLAVTM